MTGSMSKQSNRVNRTGLETGRWLNRLETGPIFKTLVNSSFLFIYLFFHLEQLVKTLNEVGPKGVMALENAAVSRLCNDLVYFD